MASVTLRARGNADPATAWERYVDPALWSSWAPQIQRVTTSTERLVAGTTGTVRAGLLRRPTLPVSFEVLAVDEALHEWEWRAHVGPIVLRLEHGVSPDGDGAATWLRVHGVLPLVLAYAPLARIALGRLVAA
jgi:hypothetical protein